MAATCTQQQLTHRRLLGLVLWLSVSGSDSRWTRTRASVTDIFWLSDLQIMQRNYFCRCFELKSECLSDIMEPSKHRFHYTMLTAVKMMDGWENWCTNDKKKSLKSALNAPVSSDNSASAQKEEREWGNQQKKEGLFFKKRVGGLFGGSQPMSAGGRGAKLSDQTIKYLMTLISSPHREKWKGAFQGLNWSWTFPSHSSYLLSDGSDGLVALQLRSRLLHLRDHQVGGGEELVCGHHQPGRAAAHHHLLSWVSRFSVCMIWGGYVVLRVVLFGNKKSRCSESDSLPRLLLH